MKKKISQTLLVFSVAIFVVISIASCSNKNVEMISKKWKLTAMHKDGEEAEIAKLDSLKKMLYISMKQEMIEKSTYTFTKDGKYTEDMGFKKAEGTYKISDDGKQITTTEMINGKPGSSETIVILLTEDKLEMSQKNEEGKEMKLNLEAVK